MKNFIKLICISVFIVTFVFVWSFRTESLKTNAAILDYKESPRTLYVNNCARCHGADGKAQTELGKLNETPDISGGKARRMSGAKLTQLISKGRGSMPGFGKKLTRAQISSIANFARGL